MPGETAFLHHLLEFVIGRPAPGVSLASLAREPHPEGAGRKCRLPVTFLIRYVASPHSFGRGVQIPAFPYSFGRGDPAFSGAVPLVDVVKPFSL